VAPALKTRTNFGRDFARRFSTRIRELNAITVLLIPGKFLKTNGSEFAIEVQGHACMTTLTPKRLATSFTRTHLAV